MGFVIGVTFLVFFLDFLFGREVIGEVDGLVGKSAQLGGELFPPAAHDSVESFLFS